MREAITVFRLLNVCILFPHFKFGKVISSCINMKHNSNFRILGIGYFYFQFSYHVSKLKFLKIVSNLE